MLAIAAGREVNMTRARGGDATSRQPTGLVVKEIFFFGLCDLSNFAVILISRCGDLPSPGWYSNPEW